jgi:hypothetical protein
MNLYNHVATTGPNQNCLSTPGSSAREGKTQGSAAHSDSNPLQDQYLYMQMAMGLTARVNRSNLSATMGYAASAPAPADGPSLTISGSAAHLSGPPRSLATYPMGPVAEAM